MVRWKKKSHPEVLLAKVRERTEVGPDGSVQFKGFEFLDYESVLFSMFDWPASMAVEDREIVASKALRAAAGENALNPRGLLSRANQIAESIQLGEPKRYVLVSTISLGRSTRIPSARIGGCYIWFPEALPRRFARVKDQIEEMAWHTVPDPWPASFTPVLVSLRASSPFSAARTAIDGMDLFRAVWNFFLNQRVGWKWSSPSRGPVNAIVSGPMKTLHKPTGELEVQTWWYDPEFRVDLPAAEVKRNLADLRRYFTWVRERLRAVQYGRELESWLRRYCRALDETNLEAAFLKLWGVLERLTMTGISESYDVTLRRALFLLKDRTYHREVLEHLRQVRNESVHHVPPDDFERLVFQLKRYVEVLFRFHLGVGAKFGDLGEVCRFLDLPTVAGRLEGEIALRVRARKYAAD